MNKNRVFTNIFFLIAFATFLHTKSFAEPANIALLHSEITAYHESGIYQKEIEQQISSAKKYLLERVASNARKTHPQKLALVLDIDETSLSNYDHMLKHNFFGSKKSIYKNIMSMNGKPIEATLSLYNLALKNHVSVFFITGRSSSLSTSTVKNLKMAGFDNWQQIYFRPKNYSDKSIVTFKSQTRASIDKQGYTIIESIGDQQSDLTGGYAEKTFKLPNPYYFIP